MADGRSGRVRIIHIVPVLIGIGIPLLDSTPRQVELKLRSTRKFADGVVRIHYDIDRTAPTSTPPST
jgi:hypothetical protein